MFLKISFTPLTEVNQTALVYNSIRDGWFKKAGISLHDQAL